MYIILNVHCKRRKREKEGKKRSDREDQDIYEGRDFDRLLYQRSILKPILIYKCTRLNKGSLLLLLDSPACCCCSSDASPSRASVSRRLFRSLSSNDLPMKMSSGSQSSTAIAFCLSFFLFFCSWRWDSSSLKCSMSSAVSATAVGCLLSMMFLQCIKEKKREKKRENWLSMCSSEEAQKVSSATCNSGNKGYSLDTTRSLSSCALSSSFSWPTTQPHMGSSRPTSSPFPRDRLC